MFYCITLSIQKNAFLNHRRRGGERWLTTGNKPGRQKQARWCDAKKRSVRGWNQTTPSFYKAVISRTLPPVWLKHKNINKMQHFCLLSPFQAVYNLWNQQRHLSWPLICCLVYRGTRCSSCRMSWRSIWRMDKPRPSNLSPAPQWRYVVILTPISDLQFPFLGLRGEAVVH